MKGPSQFFIELAQHFAGFPKISRLLVDNLLNSRCAPGLAQKHGAQKTRKQQSSGQDRPRLQ
jgi:hypothetical protein